MVLLFMITETPFGKISRITATSYVSGGGIINVERECRMSGAIHDKGAILSGYLNSIFAKIRQPILQLKSVSSKLWY